MRLDSEEEARLVEEARLKFEEEDLRLKSEKEARLAEEAMLKVEEHQRAQLKVDEGIRIILEEIRRAEEEQEDNQHARMKAEEEARLIEKARLKSEEEDLQLKAENESPIIE